MHVCHIAAVNVLVMKFVLHAGSCVLPAKTFPSHVLLGHDELLQAELTCFTVCLTLGRIGA